MSSEQQATTAAQPAPKKAMWICIIAAWVLFLAPIPGTIFLAVPVNIAAVVLAIVCLVRGATGAGVLGLICTTIGSGVLYLIGLALFAGGVAALSAPPV